MKICSVKTCQEEVVGHCSKCIPEIDLCLTHIKEHVSLSDHSPTKYKSEIILNNRLRLVKLKIKEMRTIILTETHSVIKLLKQRMKKSLETIKALNSNIKKLSDLTQVFINEKISKKISQDILDLFCFEKFKPQYLFDFKDKTNELLAFNPYSGQYTKKNISGVLPQGCCSSICQLSPGAILVSGGHSDVYLDTTYFVDISCGTARAVESGLARGYASGEVVGRYFYVFGGWSCRSRMTECSCFDLESEKWSRIQGLPSANYCSSTLSLGDFILVTGNGGNLLAKYNLQENTYESLNTGLSIHPRNILIPYKDKVFLVMYTGTYVASLCDLRKWTAVTLSTNPSFSSYTTSKPVVIGEDAFFITCNQNQVICFNCSQYSMGLVVSMS